MVDLRIFKTSNWERMSNRQRVDALQELENSMASEQRRRPRTVLPSALSNTTRGQYMPLDPDNLHINNQLIQNDHGNYQAMQTVIHEGRHAYQDDCVTRRTVPLSQDKGHLGSWAQNMPGRGGVYNNTFFVDYRYQPVETDANNYAKDKVNSFGNQYLHDPAYKQFCDKRDAQDRHTENVAISTYGNDYEQVIRRDIERRYQTQAQQQIYDNELNETEEIEQEM